MRLLDEETTKLKSLKNSTQKEKDDTKSLYESNKKSLFPKTISSVLDSSKYAKKLIVTAISNITYLRAIFPEEYYTERMFEGINCRIIKQANPEFPHTRVFTDWLNGAFDALDKKYLRCLSLSLYENSREPENVLENYNFNLSYTDKDTNLELDFADAKNAGSKAKMNAVRLFRLILCTVQSLNDLPVKIYMNMRLFYYEDVTPEDYEPEGFKSADFDKYKYANGPVLLDGGQMHSLWHHVDLKVTVDQSMLKAPDDFEAIDETFDCSSQIEEIDSGLKTLTEGQASQTEKLKTYKHVLDRSVNILMDQTNMSVCEQIDAKNSEQEDSMSLISNKISNLNVTKILATSTNGSVVDDESGSNNDDPKIIECGCELDDEENLSMIQCIKCLTWQHTICYNYNIKKPKQLKLIKQICTKCVSNDEALANEPCDKTQLGLTRPKLYELCTWRRVLIWLIEYPEKVFYQQNISDHFGLKTYLASKLVKKLESEGLVALISNIKKIKLFRIEKLSLNNYVSSNFTELNNSDEKQNLNKSVCFNLSQQNLYANKDAHSQIDNSNSLKSVKRPNEENDAKISNEISSPAEERKSRQKSPKGSPKRRRKSSISKKEIIA